MYERPSVEQDDQKAFLSFGQDHGYKIYPDTPLVEAPDSIKMMNSTIANYVQDLSTQEAFEQPVDDCRVQTCVRFRALDGIALCDQEWTTTFKMGGFITNQRSFAEVTDNTLEFLSDNYGVDRSELHWTYNAAHPQESEDLLSVGLREDQSEAVTHNSHVWVNWQFGDPGPTGHGITLSMPEQVTGELLQFCNVIAIDKVKDDQGVFHNVGTPLYDVGFGLGRTRLSLNGVRSPFGEEPYVPIVEQITKDRDIELLHAISIADFVITLEEMVGQGIVPGSKGSNSMTRKLIRNLHNIARVEHVSMEDMLALFESDVATVVEQEFLTYDKTIDRALGKLAVMHSGGFTVSQSEIAALFKSTYGLPEAITEDWLRSANLK